MGTDPDSTGERPERVRGDERHEPHRASFAGWDDVSSHLYRFERKIVRDLAWALTSRNVVGDPERERKEEVVDVPSSGEETTTRDPSNARNPSHPRVFPDEDAHRLFLDSIQWLEALDADPSHLLDWIGSQRGSNKLGFYFGALVEYGVRFNPALAAEAVTTHRQVARSLGAGRMVGQLKLVFRVAREIVHWEFNVKYFVDAGCCFFSSETSGDDASVVRSIGDTTHETSHDVESPRTTTKTFDEASYVASSFETRLEREKDDLRDWRARGASPPPAGDSCYVGPFLHENLHIRVREASRKLALARHANVARWLDRWAADALEGESIELTELGTRLAASTASAAERPESPRVGSLKKTSQQILRGYLFYPLRGDGRGGSATWRDARARGSASDAHLRGWWVRTPEELLDVKAANEASDENADEKSKSQKVEAASDDDGSDGDGRMWALFTRKCHWLGPCVATRVKDATMRDGADTEWVVRGVPELNVRDVEAVPTSAVVAAARNVLELSDRGVLVAEMVKVKTNKLVKGREHPRGASLGFEWREKSRGFVLPPKWDPWPTALRVDPFRRRYERSLVAESSRTAERREASATNAEEPQKYDERFGIPRREPSHGVDASAETEVVFDEMYPDREEVDALGDDVRVGPRRAFKGAISWKTERDEKASSSVRDWGSRDERRRRDASATCAGFEKTSSENKNTSSDFSPLNGGTPAGNGTSDPSDARPVSSASHRPGALAGASFADAASSPSSAHPAHALLVAVKRAIRAEGSVVRPARPTLVRALAAVGGADADADVLNNAKAIDGFAGKSARDAQTRSTRALVESAVRGASACLAALDDVDEDLEVDVVFENVDDVDDVDDVDTRTATRRFSMSTRRAVSHALLDALGPATRRNGCVGNAFAPYVSAVFAKCLFHEGSSCAFRKTGVCPRVAVRFAKILRVSPSAALPSPGSATTLATKLVEAIQSAIQKKNGSGSVVFQKTDPARGAFARRSGSETPNAPINVPRNPNAGGVTRRSSRSSSTPLATRTDAPASRAGAVAELLVWSGEAAAAAENLVVALAEACVDAGHASAAEALTKARAGDAFAMRARLAQTHADAGNHRAARRLASESLVDELRASDAEEAFAFFPFIPPRAGIPGDFSLKTDDDAINATSVLASALGDGDEAILVANDLDSVSSAFSWLENALLAERPRSLTPIVGFDCEWRPGPGDATTNPVTVAQFAAAGTALNECSENRNSNENTSNEKTECTAARISARVVVLDCAAAFGPDADDALAAAGARFVRRVFSECLLCGFGVASDARRLVASYPERFFSPRHGDASFAAATVCARDVAATLGGEKKNEHARASLSGLCAAVFGPGNFLDKTEQTSRWDERPLRPSQIRYAALDALAPRLALGAMLERRAARMFARDVSAACRPWTRIHALHEKEKETFSPLRPLTDADVRAALTRLGALQTSSNASSGASSLSLALVDGWRAKTQAPLSASPTRSERQASSGTSNDKRDKRQTPLLCKTLAVVAERVGDGVIELAVTCVLPARDDVRLDLDAAAVALGIFAEDDAGASKKRLRLRLANETELHRLFGFAAGSVGPFGLRDLRSVEKTETETSISETSIPTREEGLKSLKSFDARREERATKKKTAVLKTVLGSVKRAAVVDESLFAHDAIAVGGGAPDVKVVGTARAVATRADARVARITQTTP